MNDNKYLNNAFFWQKIDTMFFSNRLIITREKNDHHPLYPNLVYPTQYGYLDDTYPEDPGICVFRGSLDVTHVEAMVIAADLLKKDLEVKLLVGCTEEEEKQILHFLNQTDFQKGVLIRRGEEVPGWSVSE
ncbi:MAG: Inorganic pyrophosphatase [Erysipelotrichaceae bacterium]|nr:Inorganic pyrophosphatase [Erysipelotrichaceae bacterium]